MRRDVLSIMDFSKEELIALFEETKRIKKELEERTTLNYLRGYVMATAFFEPSTRTKLSFQTAMLRMGGEFIDLPPEEASSRAKGENFADTIKMLESYADVIVIRHKLEGAARFAAEIAEVPVINGGDGTRDHPTQAMIDLFTIFETLGRVEGLTIGVIGDLKYGRAARSFVLGISKFKPKKLYLVSPPQLSLHDDVKEIIIENGVRFEELTDLKQVIADIDVLYVTRIQRERFPDPLEYERVKGSYRVGLDILSGAKSELVILHPLPRVDELDLSLDKTPYAKYFVQAKNGVPVRMALLKTILKG
ncbi:MAG TPA: aspartate carbamoyltransferase [Thermofilum sp.]|nr:aspartate carbamoyltransferase [Thermofilum sp.]